MWPTWRRGSWDTCRRLSQQRSGATTPAPGTGCNHQEKETAMVLTPTRTESISETETFRRTRRALIDCDFHNELDTIKDLYPYLSQRWRDHIDAYGTRGPGGAYYPRFMDHRADARPPSGRRSGSEVAFSRQDFLDPYNVAHAMLIPLTPAGSQMNPER